MKIECPTCHLAGNINELELAPEGGFINCPRCKNRFHVEKPPAPAQSSHMMNTCPVCQYSTFSEEMFSVCPKCGATGTNYRDMLKKKAEREVINRSKRNPDLDLPPPRLAAIENEIPPARSVRNPDLDFAPPLEDEPPKRRIPEPVKITGGISVAVGAIFLVYGFFGLMNYYSKDWQAILSEPLLEPVSNFKVFFLLGFLPWIRTLFGAVFVAMSVQFLMLTQKSHKGLIQCAWGGVVLGVIHEIVEFINWIRVSSLSPSFSYYAVGFISSLFMIIPWAAPFLALIWFLQKEYIQCEFPDE